MSLVSETHSGDASCNDQFFLSEKLVKAIGNAHPFVVLSTPNYLSLWPLLEFFLNLISPVNYKHEHINKFNKKKLKKIMVKSGFQIIELRSFILFSPFLAFFTFNFAKSTILFDNFLTKFFPGFLLFCKLKKS